ncbi:unnamed protein product [Malus baccata var. baccata]
MGEDLFWAIRGGGGASFGVICFLENQIGFRPGNCHGITDIVHRWQYIADEVHQDPLVRVVVMPVNKKGHQTVKAKFVALFLGNGERLHALRDESLPQLCLKDEDYTEMSWI